MDGVFDYKPCHLERTMVALQNATLGEKCSAATSERIVPGLDKGSRSAISRPSDYYQIYKIKM